MKDTISTLEIKPLVNQHNIDSRIRQLEDNSDYYQQFIDQYDKMQIGVLNDADLHSLFNNPKEFLAKKIMGDNPIEINGQKIRADKYYELLEKPKELEGLVKSIETHYEKRYHQQYDIKVCVIVNGKVTLDNKVLKKIADYETVHFESIDEKKLYLAVQKICEGINDLKTITKGPFDLERMADYAILKRGDWKKEDLTSHYVDFIINPDYFKKQFQILNNRTKNKIKDGNK